MNDERFLRRKARRLRRGVMRSLKADSELKAKGVQFLGKGKPLEQREVKGLKAYWVCRGGFIESSTLRTEVTQAPQDVLGFHMYEVEDKLREKETWKELNELAAARLRDEIMRRIAGLETAGALAANPDRRLHFAVWLKDAGMKAYLEHDNWYFHVLMRIPAGGMVL